MLSSLFVVLYTNRMEPTQLLKSQIDDDMIKQEAEYIIQALEENPTQLENNLATRKVGIQAFANGGALQGYVQTQLEAMAVKALAKVDELIDSPHERIALEASTYTLDHVRGKAVQRNTNTNLNINVQSIID